MKKGSKLETFFKEYSIDGQLGEGGSGTVYLASDADGSQVAIKVLDKGKANRSRLVRFKNEYLFLHLNEHQNLVRVLDHGLSQNNEPFYVMLRYDTSLRKIIGEISPEDAIRVTQEFLQGLSVAHSADVIHRDLKPENILIDMNYSRIAVADFGISHFKEDDIYENALTKDSDKLANANYAAPEQRIRPYHVSSATDVFAAGMILHELFIGRIPIGNGYEKISNRYSNLQHLDSIVERALMQDPSARYQDAAEMLNDIRRGLPEEIITVDAEIDIDEVKNRTIQNQSDRTYSDNDISELKAKMLHLEKLANRGPRVPYQPKIEKHTDGASMSVREIAKMAIDEWFYDNFLDQTISQDDLARLCVDMRNNSLIANKYDNRDDLIDLATDQALNDLGKKVELV